MQATREAARAAKCVAAFIACCAVVTICGAWARFPGAAASQGEFDSEDPVGLARGLHIPTDCDHHIDDDAKTYCFESDSSLREFQSNPDLLSKAQSFWTREHASSGP